MSQSPAATNPAQTYEDFFVAYQFRPWTADILERAKPQPGERILDVACGTGIVARTVAHQLAGQATVVGVDISPAMIAVARAAAAREGVEVEWHEGNAIALPLPDAAFDLVLIQQGLQFFPDRVAALREVARVLDDGGRVVTATWTEITNHPLIAALAEVIRRHVGTPVLDTVFSLGDQDLLRSLFVDAGLDVITIDRVQRTVRFPEPDRFLALSMASAAAVPALQAMDDAQRTALIEAVRAEMSAPLRDHTQGDEVVLSMEAHIVVARKTG